MRTRYFILLSSAATCISLAQGSFMPSAFAQGAAAADQTGTSTGQMQMAPASGDSTASQSVPVPVDASNASQPKPSLEPVTQGKVTYVTGGIGDDESSAVKQIAGQYPLEVLLVRSAKPNREYLAEVPVTITNAKGESVLDIQAGPYLLLNLPAGKYTIQAGNQGDVKRQVLNIGHKHQRVVFEWPHAES